MCACVLYSWFKDNISPTIYIWRSDHVLRGCSLGHIVTSIFLLDYWNKKNWHFSKVMKDSNYHLMYLLFIHRIYFSLNILLNTGINCLEKSLHCVFIWWFESHTLVLYERGFFYMIIKNHLVMMINMVVY